MFLHFVKLRIIKQQKIILCYNHNKITQNNKIKKNLKILNNTKKLKQSMNFTKKQLYKNKTP